MTPTRKLFIGIICFALGAWISVNLDKILPPSKSELSAGEMMFLELQQKYSRQFPRNGYSLDFEFHEPSTFTVVVEYYPDRRYVALDVMNAGKTFVESMGRKKYGMGSLQVTTRSKEVPRPE